MFVILDPLGAKTPKLGSRFRRSNLTGIGNVAWTAAPIRQSSSVPSGPRETRRTGDASRNIGYEWLSLWPPT